MSSRSISGATDSSARERRPPWSVRLAPIVQIAPDGPFLPFCARDTDLDPDALFSNAPESEDPTSARPDESIGGDVHAGREHYLEVG